MIYDKPLNPKRPKNEHINEMKHGVVLVLLFDKHKCNNQNGTNCFDDMTDTGKYHVKGKNVKIWLPIMTFIFTT